MTMTNREKYKKNKREYLELENIYQTTQNGGNVFKKKSELCNTDDLKDRKKNYYKLSTKLSYLTNDEIKQTLNGTKKKSKGWGETFIFEVDNTLLSNQEKLNLIPISKSEIDKNKIQNQKRTKIFVKSLKITQKEYDNIFNTTNLFNLPTFYNYGIGSAGINVWRELLTHIKTTNYVLNNECENFPLLYHYRIIEDKKEHTINYNNKHIKYWNSDKNIKKYLDEKNKTTYRLILILEYFEFVSYDWLLKTKDIESYYFQAKQIIDFLNKKNILHFDSHLGNFLVDKKGKLYLSDYGLVIDKEFNLSKEELKFFDQNEKYDKYMICLNIIYSLFDFITKKENIKKYEKKLNFEWNENKKNSVVFKIIKENYLMILDNEKIKYDKNSIKKLIKNGFLMKRFLNKLKSDKNKKGTLKKW